MTGRRLRVLQVGKFYPPHRGGMESPLQLLCEGLLPAFDVSVLVANDARRTERSVVSGVPVTRCGTWLSVSSAPICPEMLSALRSTEADIVHLHLPNPPAVLAYLASGRRGRLVATYHSDIVRQKFLRAFYSPFQSLFLDRCDAIIATSLRYAETSPVLSRYLDRCHVVPFGIPLTPYDDTAASPQAAALRERYGPRIVLAVGRLVYYKGFEQLIRAMRGVPGRLLIVGEGPLRRELEAEARRVGVSDRVTLLGAVPDVVPYYHAADVFALPSTERSEAFGVVQLEAMACGKPVVNTALDSGVPSVSLDGVTGLTVPPRDPEALGRALNELLGDPARSGALGRAGRDRVRSEFSLAAMVRRTAELYGRLAVIV